MDDDTKADAPLTPDEERALRAAAELVAGSTGRLLTTLDEVRFERDAVQALHEDARELLAATRAELDAAWQATGVATTVRGLTTLADVVTTQRESAAELRRERDEAVEALRHASEVLRSLALVHCGHDGDEESGQCDADCARCAIEGALAHAASVRGGDQ